MRNTKFFNIYFKNLLHSKNIPYETVSMRRFQRLIATVYAYLTSSMLQLLVIRGDWLFTIATCNLMPNYYQPTNIYFAENKYGVNPAMHHMYPPSHHRPPGIHTKTMTPGYNEPPVLNHMTPAAASHPDPSVSTPIPLTASGMNPQMISPSHR